MGLIPARYIRRVDADVLGIYHSDLSKLLTLSKAGGGTTIRGGQTGSFLLHATPTSGSNLMLDSVGNISLNAVANKNISFGTSGAGVVSFGIHSALAGETLSGYLSIRDVGGTNRKLAVIS